MAASFLLDSNFLIYVLQSRPPVVDLMHKLVDAGERQPAISALTVYEVLTGTPEAEEPRVTEFLGKLDVIPVTAPIAARGALLAQWVLAQGQKPSVADTLIAATALVTGRVLVTYDLAHFRRLGVDLYPNLPPLSSDQVV